MMVNEPPPPPEELNNRPLHIQKDETGSSTNISQSQFNMSHEPVFGMASSMGTSNRPPPIDKLKMKDESRLSGMAQLSMGPFPPHPPPEHRVGDEKGNKFPGPLVELNKWNYELRSGSSNNRPPAPDRGPLRAPPPPKHKVGHEKAKIISAEAKPEFSCPELVIPGLWAPSVNEDYCCIYRVPNRLRRVNSEAYTPQMLLIGPLHHSKKIEARQFAKTDLRYLDYLNMELHKKMYLNGFADMYGFQTLQEFRTIIELDEQSIRENYAESTHWIQSQEFVDMILHDSVFILGFFMGTGLSDINKKGNILFAEPCLITTILEDLILLENQLPYALLEELFEPFFFKLKIEKTFREIVLQVFRFEGKIERRVKFLHFTDLFRLVRVQTLGLTEEEITRAQDKPPKSIKNLHNADKLDSAGVEFVNVDKENELSLMIHFERGILKLPCFIAEDNTERVMRNIMALEQCHYPYNAYVCNYVAFWDFLIDTELDVDLLLNKEVVKNWLGQQGSVVEMVNSLSLGIVDFGSHYYPIAESLNNHYKSRLNRSVATLRRVYFKDLWTGTATVAAVILLVLTLIQTVASVLQVTPSDD